MDGGLRNYVDTGKGFVCLNYGLFTLETRPCPAEAVVKGLVYCAFATFGDRYLPTIRQPDERFGALGCSGYVKAVWPTPTNQFVAIPTS